MCHCVLAVFAESPPVPPVLALLALALTQQFVVFAESTLTQSTPVLALLAQPD